MTMCSPAEQKEVRAFPPREGMYNCSKMTRRPTHLTVDHIYGDGCKHNCISGNVMRMECRMDQTGCKKTNWEMSAIIQIGYNDGVRRWGNGSLGDIFKNIDVKLAGLEN